MIVWGIKEKMLETYDGDKAVPVTQLDMSDNYIARIADNKLYVGISKNKSAGKQLEGVYKKLGFVPRMTVAVDYDEKLAQFNNVGTEVPIDGLVKAGDIIKLRGVSKGKGFAGVMKRWGMHGGPKTRGQAIRARHQGSIGSQTPGKVWKGKKMPGRFGADVVTTKGVKVVKVEKNRLWVKGAVPGAYGTYVAVVIS